MLCVGYYRMCDVRMFITHKLILPHLFIKIRRSELSQSISYKWRAHCGIINMKHHHLNRFNNKVNMKSNNSLALNASLGSEVLPFMLWTSRFKCFLSRRMDGMKVVLTVTIIKCEMVYLHFRYRKACDRQWKIRNNMVTVIL